MRIATQYSHLNGLEYLEARKPDLLNEVYAAISAVDAEACRTKNSQEKPRLGAYSFHPTK
jgi:hypothetical protein